MKGGELPLIEERTETGAAFVPGEGSPPSVAPRQLPPRGGKRRISDTGILGRTDAEAAAFGGFDDSGDGGGGDASLLEGVDQVWGFDDSGGDEEASGGLGVVEEGFLEGGEVSACFDGEAGSVVLAVSGLSA